MKVPVSWLREFVAVPHDAGEVASRLGSCGFAVESVEGDVIDVEVTANRPDCLSVYGLAREAAVAFAAPLKPRTGAPAAGTLPASTIGVTIDDAACGRYAVATADVSVAASPAWLADRLTAAGVRPINNIVDATNYVMLEIGQPMHAFDAARIAGREIHARAGRAGERLVTLDGQNRAIDPSMLVIGDHDRAMAIAGVMGGAESEVTPATKSIAIESAWFVPASVRATSKKLGLKTEASTRFERGVDPGAAPAALERVLALLTQIGAGSQTSAITDVQPQPRAARTIGLDRGRVARLLGDVIPDADIVRILSQLGFVLAPATDGWSVIVPSFRVDVAREADLIEDVGRHWGFDRIPATLPALAGAARESLSPSIARDRAIRRVLTGAGFTEAATFTFIEAAAAAPFAARDQPLVPIANPLSEKFAVLRPSLLPGLIDAVVYNRHRQADTVRLFEVGAVFAPGGERSHLAWMITGPRSDHWSERPAPADVFDAIGVATALGAAFGVAISSAAAEAEVGLAPGRAASLHVAPADGPPVRAGAAGELRADILAARGLDGAGAVVGGWIDLAALGTAGQGLPRPITPLPRYPSVVRDLSIVVDERLPAAEVRGTIRAHAPATLVAVREFDRYQGKGVPEGRISISVRLTFRGADRTLTDAEVQQAVDTLVAALARDHGAVLR